MSGLGGLAPLLDLSALWDIARHLFRAQHDLAQRTGPESLTRMQFLVALGLYIVEQDSRRAEAAEPMPAPVSSPFLREFLGRVLPSPRAAPSQGTGAALLREKGVRPGVVRRLVAHADLAYCDTKRALVDGLGARCPRSALLEVRAHSYTHHPAYFVAHDVALGALVLSVRGSKETSDFVTNLMVDITPFGGGYGHRGIVQSAQNLAVVVCPSIAAFLEARRPPNGLHVVGHSLGAAVASLVAIMLRTGSLDYHVHFAWAPPEAASPRRGFSEGEARSRSSTTSRGGRRGAAGHGDEGASVYSSFSRFARLKMSSANCVAFCPPPCLSPDEAEKAKALGVITFVHGLDMVPRLSAGSLDRFLLAVSRHGSQAGCTRSAQGWLSPLLFRALGHGGGGTAASTSADAGPGTLGHVLGRFQRGAQQTPAAGDAGAGRGGTDTRSSTLQEFVVGAVAVGGGLLLDEFYRDDRPRTSENRNRVVPNRPRELHLAGTILHIKRPFTPARNCREDATLPPATLLERTPEYFVDIEASTWMLHDHAMVSTGVSLTSILDGGAS